MIDREMQGLLLGFFGGGAFWMRLGAWLVTRRYVAGGPRDGGVRPQQPDQERP